MIYAVLRTTFFPTDVLTTSPSFAYWIFIISHTTFFTKIHNAHTFKARFALYRHTHSCSAELCFWNCWGPLFKEGYHYLRWCGSKAHGLQNEVKLGEVIPEWFLENRLLSTLTRIGIQTVSVGWSWVSGADAYMDSGEELLHEHSHLGYMKVSSEQILSRR